MKAVLIRKSTQEVIKKGKYPNRKMNPIVGLDADLEWLLVVNKPNPSYDPLTHKLVQKANKITDNPHPEYPHLNTYKVSTKAVEMTEQEIENYIESEEDKDFSAISVDQHKEAGVKLFNRFFFKLSIILSVVQFLEQLQILVTKRSRIFTPCLVWVTSGWNWRP